MQLTKLFLLLLSVSYATADDFYQLLGVSRMATTQQIKKAFKKFALKYHPDKNDSPEAAEKFRKYLEAYETLSKQDKRNQYNRMGHNSYINKDNSNVNDDDIFKSFFDDFGFDARAGGSHHHAGGGGPIDIDEFIRQAHGGGGPSGMFFTMDGRPFQQSNDAFDDILFDPFWSDDSVEESFGDGNSFFGGGHFKQHMNNHNTADQHHQQHQQQHQQQQEQHSYAKHQQFEDDEVFDDLFMDFGGNNQFGESFFGEERSSSSKRVVKSCTTTTKINASGQRVESTQCEFIEQ